MGCTSGSFRCAALQVQRQQAAQDFVIGHVCRVVRPAIGGRHRRIQLRMGAASQAGRWL